MMTPVEWVLVQRDDGWGRRSSLVALWCQGRLGSRRRGPVGTYARSSHC